MDNTVCAQELFVKEHIVLFVINHYFCYKQKHIVKLIKPIATTAFP